MADKIQLDLVTPEELVLSAEYDEVIATSVIGEFGVLPMHAPLVTLLKPGIVVAKKEGDREVFAVQSGMAEVEPQKMIILTEKAEPAEEIDVEETKREIARIEEETKEFKESIDSPEFKVISDKLDWLKAKLSAATYSEK